MIDTQTDGRAMCTADVEEGHQPVVYLLHLGSIRLVGVGEMAEGAGRIDIVAGVNAHFLYIEGGDISHMGIEVYIGHQRRGNAFCPQGSMDVPEVLRLTHPLRGKPHILTARLHDASSLRHTGLRVISRGGGHGLHADGVLPAQRRVAYMNDR